MPMVRFGESICVDERELLLADGIWDVEAKQLEYFKKFGRCGFKRLPNEMILHLIDPLERRDLLNFGQVSKRMRAITQERIQSWRCLTEFNGQYTYCFGGAIFKKS